MQTLTGHDIFVRTSLFPRHIILRTHKTTINYRTNYLTDFYFCVFARVKNTESLRFDSNVN